MMFKSRIGIVLLLFTASIHQLQGQSSGIWSPSGEEKFCCLTLPSLPFTASTYRLSVQYGLAENDELGTGHIFGAELAWYPTQTLTMYRRHIAAALKLAFNNTGAYGPNKPYLSFFIETDLFFRKPKESENKIFIVDPYIGLDFGITEGFLHNTDSKFALAPISGINFNLSNFFAIFVYAKYSFIYENPQSEMLQFNLGVQWNAASMFFIRNDLPDN